jgi:pimeloyl-ACP methyl ester carboxylesterase
LTLKRCAGSWKWLIAVVVVALGVPAAAWLAQERLIFFPQPIASTAHLPGRASALEIVAADGTHLRGWMVKADTAVAPTVIYFGGNAEEVSWTLAEKRWPRDWTIAAINYRGYGASEGTPGERDLLADALAIYDVIAKRDDVDPRRIVVFGRSLGTGGRRARGCAAAGRRCRAGCRPMTAWWRSASITIRGCRSRCFYGIASMPSPDAGRAQMPLLVLVAQSDAIISGERSRALFDQWAGPKTWQEVPWVDHNSLGAYRCVLGKRRALSGATLIRRWCPAGTAPALLSEQRSRFRRGLMR